MQSTEKPGGEPEIPPAADGPTRGESSQGQTDTAAAPESLDQQFDLAGLVRGLVGDLRELRAGIISVPDAKARAELARQALRGVHYVVTAQKFLAGAAKMITNEAVDEETKPSKRKGPADLDLEAEKSD